MKRLELAGKRFGRLVAIKIMGKTAHGKAIWLCKCDCGEEKNVSSNSLGRSTLSCGCIRREWRSSNNPGWKHGLYGTKEYRAWQNMKRRCYSKSHTNYKHYGARGIKVSKKWLNSFMAFFNHIGPAPSKKHTVDRKRNNDDYKPGNVRWATPSQQRLNQRRRQPNATHKS